MSETPLPLAEFVIPEPEPEETPAERYARWIDLNPWVLDVLERLADDYVSRGATRLSMKHLVEIVRWEHGRATRGDTFRVNNTWTAYLSRSLIERRPDMRDLFELRERRAA